MVSCLYLVRHSSQTACDKQEEGGDDVKLVWFLCSGLYMCYNDRYRRKQGREAELIPKTGLSLDWSL